MWDTDIAVFAKVFIFKYTIKLLDSLKFIYRIPTSRKQQKINPTPPKKEENNTGKIESNKIEHKNLSRKQKHPKICF